MNRRNTDKLKVFESEVVKMCKLMPCAFVENYVLLSIKNIYKWFNISLSYLILIDAYECNGCL